MGHSWHLEIQLAKTRILYVWWENSELLINKIMADKATLHAGGNYQLVQISVGTWYDNCPDGMGLTACGNSCKKSDGITTGQLELMKSLVDYTSGIISNPCFPLLSLTWTLQEWLLKADSEAQPHPSAHNRKRSRVFGGVNKTAQPMARNYNYSNLPMDVITRIRTKYDLNSLSPVFRFPPLSCFAVAQVFVCMCWVTRRKLRVPSKR